MEQTDHSVPFWRRKSLEEMSRTEWESLCDGCAKCCLIKYEDDDTGDVYYTNIVCRLLDIETCRCRNYDARSEIVPECASLTPDLVRSFEWLPETCAYRLVAEGKDLPEWHPLVSGNPSSTFESGMSVKAQNPLVEPEKLRPPRPESLT